jgi:RimJ/RimL family protein N-acetyltransferase
MNSIKTPTLLLEPIRAAHAEVMHPDLTHAPVYRYLRETVPSSLGDLRSKFAGWESLNRLERSLLTWIFMPQGGSPVGYVQAELMPSENSASISYVLSMHHRGHGYALSAVEGVIDHLRVEDGVARFRASVHPRNAPAIKLLRHLAFVQISNGAANARGPKSAANLLFVL